MCKFRIVRRGGVLCANARAAQHNMIRVQRKRGSMLLCFDVPFAKTFHKINRLAA